MEEKYLIESMEHTLGNAKAWWRPNSIGYTTNILEAGKYSKEEAEQICERAGEDNERMWSEGDVYAGKAGLVELVVRT